MRFHLALSTLGLCVGLGAAPHPAVAQATVRPQPSVLRVDVARPHAVPPGARMSEQSKDAIIGGVLGALIGGIAGHAMCRRFGTTGDCTGDAVFWGAAGGALGLLMGASTGYEADH